MVAQLKAPAGPRRLIMKPQTILDADGRERLIHHIRHGSPEVRHFRTPDTDRTGAIVQRVILRYILGGESRADLAQEYGYSVRQLQSWLSGVAYGSYGRPVLDALAALGIGRGCGQRLHGQNTRLLEIIAAQRRLMAEAVMVAQGSIPASRRLIRGLRLFSTDWSQE